MYGAHGLMSALYAWLHRYVQTERPERASMHSRVETNPMDSMSTLSPMPYIVIA
jgi:hypothetical protein